MTATDTNVVRFIELPRLRGRVGHTSLSGHDHTVPSWVGVVPANDPCAAAKTRLYSIASSARNRIEDARRAQDNDHGNSRMQLFFEPLVRLQCAKPGRKDAPEFGLGHAAIVGR